MMAFEYSGGRYRTRQVPDPRRAVIRPGHEPMPVRAKHHAMDRAAMALEYGGNCCRPRQVPDPCRVVFRSGHHPPSIRAECNAGDRPFMPDKPVFLAIAQPRIQQRRRRGVADRSIGFARIFRQHGKSSQHAGHRITAFGRLTRQGRNRAGFLQLSLLIERV